MRTDIEHEDANLSPEQDAELLRVNAALGIGREAAEQAGFNVCWTHMENLNPELKDNPIAKDAARAFYRFAFNSARNRVGMRRVEVY